MKLKAVIFIVSLIIGQNIYTEKIWFDNRTSKKLALEEHIGGSATTPFFIRPMGTIAPGQITNRNLPDGRLYIGDPQRQGSYHLISRANIERLAAECGNELAVILNPSHLKGEFSVEMGCARNGLLGKKQRSN